MYNALLIFCTNDVDEFGQSSIQVTRNSPLVFMLLSRQNIKSLIDTKLNSLSYKGSQSCSQVRHYSLLGLKELITFVTSYNYNNNSLITTYVTPLQNPHITANPMFREFNIFNFFLIRSCTYVLSPCNSSFILTCFLSNKQLLIKTSCVMYLIPLSST